VADQLLIEDGNVKFWRPCFKLVPGVFQLFIKLFELLFALCFVRSLDVDFLLCLLYFFIQGRDGGQVPQRLGSVPAPLAVIDELDRPPGEVMVGGMPVEFRGEPLAGRRRK
jgi:hypothetical protein